MDDAKRVIAIGHAVDEDPHRKKVIDLFVRLVPFFHLFVDRPEMLGTSRHLDVDDSCLSEMRLERLLQLCDRFFPLGAAGRDFLGEYLVLRRLEVLEGQVLQFPPHSRHAEAVGKRRV